MSDYTKSTWIDRNVQYPNRYLDELGNSKTFTTSPGTVTEEGSYVSASRMNNIETGLYNAHLEIEKSRIYKPSDTIVLSANTERTQYGTASTKKKEFKNKYAGFFRLKFELKIDDAVSTKVYYAIFLNGAAVSGAAGSVQSTAYTLVSYDFTTLVNPDSSISINIYTDGSLRTGYIKNATLRGTLTELDNTVLLD